MNKLAINAWALVILRLFCETVLGNNVWIIHIGIEVGNFFIADGPDQVAGYHEIDFDATLLEQVALRKEHAFGFAPKQVAVDEDNVIILQNYLLLALLFVCNCCQYNARCATLRNNDRWLAPIGKGVVLNNFLLELLNLIEIWLGVLRMMWRVLQTLQRMHGVHTRIAFPLVFFDIVECKVTDVVVLVILLLLEWEIVVVVEACLYFLLFNLDWVL